MKTDERTMTEYGVVTEPGTVRFERLLPGPVERVWEYLTDSTKRGTWLASGEIEPRVGGRVEHVFRNAELTQDDDPPPAKYAQYGGTIVTEGRVTAYDPPRLLSYTWAESAGESEVTYELAAQADKVLLVLTHRRISDRNEMLSAAGGWHLHLNILADRLAGREPAGFWSSVERLEAEYDRLL